jgi:phosphopantothenoylcysteine synthetase/decarboxylase
LNLKQGPKHIKELSKSVGDAKRIGFKLETNVTVEELHQRALEQISNYDVDATVANLMEEMHNSSTPRAYFVTRESIVELNDLESMCKSILSVLTP